MSLDALLNRRDVTAAREAQQQPTSQHELDSRSSLAVAAAELTKVVRLMGREVLAERTKIGQLAVTDREPAQMVMKNWPVPGADRLIVRRPGTGGTYVLAAGTPQVVCQPNENRLGIYVVNVGATNPATLYFSTDLLEPGTGTPLTIGAAQIGLPALQSWNGKLGDAVWCGTIYAISSSGTTLTVAEV